MFIDIADNDGVTALMLASVNGHTDVVKLLLENGSNPDLISADDFSADYSRYAYTVIYF